MEIRSPMNSLMPPIPFLIGILNNLLKSPLWKMAFNNIYENQSNYDFIIYCFSFLLNMTIMLEVGISCPHLLKLKRK